MIRTLTNKRPTNIVWLKNKNKFKVMSINQNNW